MNYEEKYLSVLKERYRSRGELISALVSECVGLGLDKGSEHYLSDLHGEHEAFIHITRSASGIIRERIRELYGEDLSEEERAELLTVICYPEEKLERIAKKGEGSTSLVQRLSGYMLGLCERFSRRYTEEELTKRTRHAAGGFYGCIREMLTAYSEGRRERLSRVYLTLSRCGAEKEMLIALAATVRRLAVDRVHIVGDIFDRGPRPDMILDILIDEEETVDIQWGNHDILWIGASLGERAAVATAVANSLAYGNTEVLEIGYGISLAPLYRLAEELYGDDPAETFMPKGDVEVGSERAIARMHKAISIIRFKLEGELIIRHPEYGMEDRLLLDKIDAERETVRINDAVYRIKDGWLPSVDIEEPYKLSTEEVRTIEALSRSFICSERLGRHIDFLISHGAPYLINNENLIFHGCIPMTEEGELMPLKAIGGLRGKSLMDRIDKTIREAVSGVGDRGDILWFLWCGKASPFSGKDRTCVFERLFINDKSAQEEKRNAYYNTWQSEELVKKLLFEFGLRSSRSRIINGHIPQKKGECPIKAGGRLIVIDGGFCSAYHKLSGIAGYTLTESASGMRLSAHTPFPGRMAAIENNADIYSESITVYRSRCRIKVRECDRGRELRELIGDQMLLLAREK